MQRNLRFLRPILALLAAAVLVQGCGSHSAAVARQPLGSLRLALVGRPTSINPLALSDASGVALDSLIYDGLVRIAPNLEPRPDLAKSWSVSADGRLYTFHLNPKARWQDGKKVTAQDVAFSLRTYRDPANGSALAQELQVVKAVRTLGTYTVQIALMRPYAPFLAQVASLPVLPEHLLKAVGAGKALLAQPELTAHPIGSGPFRLVRLIASGALLVRNPHYFLGAPRLASVHLVFSPSATAALEALRQGKVDYAPVPDLDATAVSTWPGIRLQHTVALQFASIVWNVDLPPFSSPAVRRALYFAVDRKKIVATALGGYGSLSDGPVPPSSWAYDPAIGHRPYDPRKALSILASLGWHQVHGVLRGPTGQPLRLSILTTQGVASRTMALGLLVRGLEAIGVQVTVHSEVFSRFLDDYIAGNFEAAFVERGLTADPDVTSYFGSPQINSSGENAGLYNDKTVDQTLVAERDALDQSGRRAAIWQMQQAMAVNPPALFLYFPYDVVALSRHVGHFAIDPTGAFWNAQIWQKLTP